MGNTTESGSRMPDDCDSARTGDADSLPTQARLARDERTAALRALAGRLAHQIRNPLAAVRAACSSLQAEIEDAEQRETLELTLNEIDRMLGFVKATVQTLPEHVERPVMIDVVAETRDVIDIVGSGHEDTMDIQISGVHELTCSLPRDGFRVSVYSILEHIVGSPGVDRVAVDVSLRGGRVLIRFDIPVSDTLDDPLSDGVADLGGLTHPVGLLVAERFARDLGGYLSRSAAGDTRQSFTLALPCSGA